MKRLRDDKHLLSHTISQIPVQEPDRGGEQGFQDRHLTVHSFVTTTRHPRQGSKSNSWNVLADNHEVHFKCDTHHTEYHDISCIRRTINISRHQISALYQPGWLTIKLISDGKFRLRKTDKMCYHCEKYQWMTSPRRPLSSESLSLCGPLGRV